MSDALLDRLVNSPRLGLTRNDYEPDVCFFSRAKSRTFQPGQLKFPAPDLIAEVLSASTEAVDRKIKFDDYAAHGAREYWIIDPDAELIEQYLLDGDAYVLHLKMNSGTLASRVVEGFEIPVRAIFDEKENLAALRKLLWAGWMNALWNQIADKAGVILSPEQHQLFDGYLDLLLAANQQMNLTRIVDRGSAEVGHIGDSLTLLSWLPKGPLRLADVGSGGGVPSIPLAIARPDINVFLIESTGKKARFLRWAAGELGLTNVHVLDQRVEEAGLEKETRESFDVVTCRAVGTMNWLAEWCVPLLKVGGKLLAMKGPKASEELPLAEHAIRLTGGGNPDVRPAELPGAINHVIVEITKKRPTPAAYPRHPSAAKGRPL